MMKIKNILINGTILRLVVCLLHRIFNNVNNNSATTAVISNEGIQSLLIDPLYSLQHFRELCHLSRLYTNGMLNIVSTSSSSSASSPSFLNIHFDPDGKPVVLLAFLDAVFQKISTSTSTPLTIHVLFVLFTIATDLLTAVQLYRLAKNVVSFPCIDNDNDDTSNTLTLTQTVDDKWEQKMERKMNPLIHPEYTWAIDGISFGEEFEDGDTGTDSANNNVNHQENRENDDNPDARTKSQQRQPQPQPQQRRALFHISNIATLCCMMYYLNPITVLATSIYPTFQGVQHLLLVSAFQVATDRSVGAIADRNTATISTGTHVRTSKGTSKKVLVSTCLLAILAYFEMYLVIFLSPLIGCFRHICLGNGGGGGSTKQVMGWCIFSFTAWYIMINFVSFQLLSSRKSSDSSSASETIYSIIQTLNVGRDHTILSPNIGIQWYLFMNIFSRCRHFFVVSTKAFPWIFVAPFTLRFYRYPMALVAMFQLFLAILKQSPTLHDMSFGIALLLLQPRSLIRMQRFSIIALLAIPVTIFIYIVDYWLWLESGTGNPNYLFFQCLAYNVFLMAIVLQFVSATMKRDKALRLTEKQSVLRLN